MFVEVQKMWGIFLRLALARFYGAPTKDVSRFLITFVDRLLNFGIFMTRGGDYTTFQLEFVSQNSREVISILR